MAEIIEIPSGAEPQGEVILSVIVGGNDSDLTRPEIIYEGDYSSKPFATIQAAIDSLEKNRTPKTTINIGPGEFDGFALANRTQEKRLLIQGSMGTPIGPFTTASLGSDPWIFNIGAVAWTPGDYRGYRLNILSGPYAGSQRVVYGNDVSEIELATHSGLGVGSVFELIPLTTVIRGAPSTGIDLSCASLVGQYVFSQLQFKGDGLYSVSVTTCQGSTIRFDWCATDLDENTWAVLSEAGTIILRHCWSYYFEFENWIGGSYSYYPDDVFAEFEGNAWVDTAWSYGFDIWGHAGYGYYYHLNVGSGITVEGTDIEYFQQMKTYGFTVQFATASLTTNSYFFGPVNFRNCWNNKIYFGYVRSTSYWLVDGARVYGALTRPAALDPRLYLYGTGVDTPQEIHLLSTFASSPATLAEHTQKISSALLTVAVTP